MSRGRVPSRVLRELAGIAPGWGVEMTGGNHLKLTHPRAGVVYAALTPSDHRSRRNLAAQIRRAERACRG